MLDVTCVKTVAPAFKSKCHVCARIIYKIKISGKPKRKNKERERDRDRAAHFEKTNDTYGVAFYGKF